MAPVASAPTPRHRDPHATSPEQDTQQTPTEPDDAGPHPPAPRAPDASKVSGRVVTALRTQMDEAREVFRIAGPALRAAVLGPAAVAAVTLAIALAVSGLVGGNEPSPTIDTGIVPVRAPAAVPDGEAAAIVADLRAAAETARKRRLEAQREAAAEPAPAAPSDADAAAGDAADPAAGQPAGTAETTSAPERRPDGGEDGRAGSLGRRSRRPAATAERDRRPPEVIGRTAEPDATAAPPDAPADQTPPAPAAP